MCYLKTISRHLSGGCDHRGQHRSWSYIGPPDIRAGAIFSRTDIPQSASWFEDRYAEALGRPRYVYVDISAGNCHNTIHRLPMHYRYIEEYNNIFCSDELLQLLFH